MTTRAEQLEAFYRQVWEQGDLEAVERLFRPDSRAGGIVPDMQAGPEEFRTLVQATLELMSRPRISMDVMLEQGDWVAAFTTFEARALAGGERVACGGMVFVRFEGDRMAEAYNCFDFVTFFEQLGLLPKDTVAMCLSGHRIG